MKRIGFGILGCGVIGPAHAMALSRIEDARLVAVCDLSEERARSLAQKQGCKYYLDFEEMLRDPEVEVVTIATPSGSHAQLVVTAAKAGKHVIVEKPLDVTLAKIDLAVEECRRQGVVLAPILNTRFSQVSQAVYQAIRDGRFGRLLMGDVYVKYSRSQDYYGSSGWRGTWRHDGGGALMNQGIHYLDRMLWFMGGAESVVAKMDALNHDIEVEDAVCAAVRYKSGGLGVVEATTVSYTGEMRAIEAGANPYQDLYSRLEVLGSDGTAFIEDEKLVRLLLRDGRSLVEPSASPEKLWAGHEAQFRDVIASIREGRDPQVTAGDARRAVQTILAIYQASWSGREVRVEEVTDESLARSSPKRT